MSFDPAVMAALKALAPDVPRGLVTGSYYFHNGEPWYPDKLTDARAQGAREPRGKRPRRSLLLCLRRARPAIGVAERIRRELALPLFTWTVRTEEQRRVAAQWADAPVFEGYEA